MGTMLEITRGGRGARLLKKKSVFSRLFSHF